MSSKLIKKYETEYGQYEICELENYILLYTDGAYYSIENKEAEISCDFVNPFMKLYPSMLTPDVESFLMLGGGTFSFLKYYLKYTNGKIDTVEIDEKLYAIACKYFNLSYNLDLYDKDRNRSHIYFENAIDFVKNTDKKYDGLFIDLFFGDNVTNSIFTDDNFEKCLRLVNEEGFLMINYIHKKGTPLTELSKIYNKLNIFFKNVRIVSLEKVTPEDYGNVLIIGSNREITLNPNVVIKDFNYELLLINKETMITTES